MWVKSESFAIPKWVCTNKVVTSKHNSVSERSESGKMEHFLKCHTMVELADGTAAEVDLPRAGWTKTTAHEIVLARGCEMVNRM